MRVRPHDLSKYKRAETLDALYTATSALQGKKAMSEFLHGLLTESERIMIGRRILIARALLSGQTYDEIVSEYKVGKDTVLKISNWVALQLPGYDQAIKEVKKEFDKRAVTKEEKRLYATSALYRLKKKYPMHFLLFPTPKLKK